MTSGLNNSKYALSANEELAFQGFKSAYNGLLPELLNGTRFTPDQLDVTTDSPYSLLDQGFIQNFDQVVTQIQDTLTSSSGPIADLAKNDPTLANSLNNISNNGVIDQYTKDALLRLSGMNTGDAALDARIDAAHTLVSQYNALPQSVQSKIETTELLLNRSPNSANKTAQAQTLVSLLEDELGVSQNGPTVNIDDVTSRALLNRMQMLKVAYADQDTDNFNPMNFDDKAMHFLQRIQTKQMAELNLKESDMQMFRLQMLSLRMNNQESPVSGENQLADTMLLLDGLRYMNNGSLPGGASTAPPSVNNNWGQNDDPYDICFFKADVYQGALNNKVEINDLMTVHQGDGAWRNDLRDKAIERIRDKFANWEPSQFNDNHETMKTLMAKLDLYEANKLDSGVTLTREELGIITLEMVSIQAQEKRPDIIKSDRDIGQAMRDGDYRISENELHIIDQGMGVDQRLYDDMIKAAESGDLLSKVAAESPHLADFYLRPEIADYREAKWSSRFEKEGETHVAPYEEFIEKPGQTGRAEYNQGVEEYLKKISVIQSNQTASTNTQDNPQASLGPTSTTFRDVVGNEDENQILVTANDVTGNTVIEGDLPSVGPQEQASPRLAQIAATS